MSNLQRYLRETLGWARNYFATPISTEEESTSHQDERNTCNSSIDLNKDSSGSLCSTHCRDDDPRNCCSLSSEKQCCTRFSQDTLSGIHQEKLHCNADDMSLAGSDDLKQRNAEFSKSQSAMVEESDAKLKMPEDIGSSTKTLVSSDMKQQTATTFQTLIASDEISSESIICTQDPLVATDDDSEQKYSGNE